MTPLFSYRGWLLCASAEGPTHHWHFGAPYEQPVLDYSWSMMHDCPDNIVSHDGPPQED